jgi:hypothetical protein
MIAILNIIWVIYSMLEGFREGFYWNYRANSIIEDDFEIHPIFSAQRGIVLILIGLLLFKLISWISIVNVIGMMLIFSFFHNGTYYCTRNRLDNNIYKLRWKDQSTTSTAKMTKIMTYRNRLIFMIVGVLIQFTYLFF